MPALRRSIALSLVTAGALAAGAVGYGGYQLESALRASNGTVAVGGTSAGTEPARWGGGRYAGDSGAWDSDGWWGAGSDGTGAGGSGTDGSGTGSSGTGSPGTGSPGTATAAGTTTEATARQLRGVVDIVTTVDYGQSQAAGTGIVLTSGGEVLTNNHVVDGATTITVTVLSTGRSYVATVVGTSPTNDLAVLRLRGASGLTTAPMGTSSSVAVGDAVTGVGNAGNDPGTAAASGTVTALDQQVTASDGDGTSETVTGLIRTSAPIQSGDSGGPLLDSAGKVIGIDTAAETSGYAGQTVAGYAIPIDHALDVATAILSGTDNATYHQGLPAFLGVQTGGSGAYAGSTAAGVPVVGVVTGSAAERAGLQAGDTITRVSGTAVSSQTELTGVLARRSPGDRVVVSWVNSSGVAHHATVTLGSGPAD
ncbi:trypsin-like peptidase domain-containing protein [Phycicoccus sp. M110.8]|uniref:S1C family serine protease n=1 Tax=Phycicoccus sp. M110.8 TaxID=3075433 RepID=UPI0028FD313E|nr:trypsin-like peptidase domain-containing protein [Phycicoccus sp. M110.8]MDU0312757.1 trypsin-like peptidase domain-containing protein [Phycicoccus sp. M110.8]